MGFIGLVAISQNENVNADLAFFYLILQKQNLYISGMLIFLSISLAISSIDTIINAISSLILYGGLRALLWKIKS